MNIHTGRRLSFGRWILAERQRRRLQAGGLASRCGVNVGTVSRVERDLVEPTLEIALRLCAGLDLALSDYVRAAAPEVLPRASRRLSWAGPDQAVLSAVDVAGFVSLSGRHWKSAQRLFEDLLDRIQAVRPGIRREVRHSLAEHLLDFWDDDRSGFLPGLMPYDYDLEYPPDEDGDRAIRLHRLGGLLTYHDVGLYLRHARLDRSLTLAGLEEAAGISDSVVNRLESGSLEKIKLASLVQLDEQLACRGELLALSWRAAEFHSGLMLRWVEARRARRAGWDRLEFRTALQLVKASRWLDDPTPDGASWLEELRVALAGDTKSRRG